MRFSPTRVNTFKWCPRQYYYRYILHLPIKQTKQMERGIYVHALASAWINGRTDLVRPEDSWVYATGQNIFNQIRQHFKPKIKALSEIEMWKGYYNDQVGGIIDYIDNEQIIDFKAVERVDKWRAPIQLAMYRYVAGRRNRYCYLHVSETDYKYLCFNDKDLDFYDIEWQKIIESIKDYTNIYELSGEPFPAHRTRYCKKYCSFYKKCKEDK